MKALATKFGAIVMSFLLLFSTLSFSVDMHFCGHSLVDVALFDEASDCGMSQYADLMDSFGCCSDKEIVVDGQDDLQAIAKWQPEVPPAFVAPRILGLVSEAVITEQDLSIPPEYSPPPLISDLPIVFQQFRI
ncbi:hypothetical protein SAMN04490243_0130 [Robiginitalea myxolifaciens]|uniref:Uncharacterized protein n=1 Tax=Robiginitalea myxolifaciens TaxID=400055 RepID=A0A1I6FMX3_9FLAO|nr:hypothetical protein [Robiginitalea myxolifaciens]SFR31303.1 hypothetical protein SAMN04490243_0130 [Robiginitalea myxolifaciens]